VERIADAVGEFDNTMEVMLREQIAEPPSDAPLVPSGSRLKFSNDRALRVLRENGYITAPCAFGRQQPPGLQWKHSPVTWTRSAEIDAMGVAVLAMVPNVHSFSPLGMPAPDSTWLGYIEIKAHPLELSAQVHEIVASFAGSRKLPTRLASDGRTLWPFKLDAPFPTVDRLFFFDEPGRKIEFRAACHQEAIVLEGNDSLGRSYRWHAGVSPLNVKRADLPSLGFNEVQGLQRLIDALRISGTAPTTGKRRKNAAT
jgi:hypothetical protein